VLVFLQDITGVSWREAERHLKDKWQLARKQGETLTLIVMPSDFPEGRVGQLGFINGPMRAVFMAHTVIMLPGTILKSR
jgi:hypothetical protein